VATAFWGCRRASEAPGEVPERRESLDRTIRARGCRTLEQARRFARTRSARPSGNDTAWSTHDRSPPHLWRSERLLVEARWAASPV